MRLRKHDFIKDKFDSISKSKRPSKRHTKELKWAIESFVIELSISLKSKHKIQLDDETEKHSIAVAKLALLIGLALDFTEEELVNIASGALIHDIGKCLIPREILQKPSKLSNDEMKVVKEHSLLGYELISSLNLPNDVKMMILDHHEWIDGSGYPANKKASEINYYAKIISICDVFEAYSSKRCYKSKVDFDVVMNFLLSQRDIQFDSDIVNVFHNSVYSAMNLNKVLKLGGSELGQASYLVPRPRYAFQ